MREALRCDTIPEPYLAKGEKSWNNLLVTQPINSCSCTLDFIETVKNSQKGFFILFDAYHVPLNTSQPMTMPIAHWRITEANLAVCQTESAASYHGWALIMAMAMVLSWLLTRMQKEDRMCKILLGGFRKAEVTRHVSTIYQVVTHLPHRQADTGRRALKFPPELTF